MTPARTSSRPALVIAGVLALAMTALTVILVSGLGYFSRGTPWTFIWLTTALWALFGVGVVVVRRLPLKAALIVIVSGSILMGGSAMIAPPNISSDSARYAWDGIVANAGISPYKYTPVDDALASLRTPWLFAEPQVRDNGSHYCVGRQMYLGTTVPSGNLICTAINRPSVHTIYPAAGELYFAAVRFFVPPSVQYWPLQLTGLLLSLGITLALILGLKKRSLDPRMAVLWAWCPLVGAEAINNAHVDILGALLVVVAGLLISRGLRFRGGIALGAAIAVKLVPAIAVPAMLRRQPVRVIVTTLATFAVLYIPYVIVSGLAVIGFLPGYLTEEGYDAGSRFILLSIFLPPAIALPVAVLILAVTAILVWVKTNPTSPWLGQLVMIGVTLLIASPRYPWYALLLVPFIALSGRWEWFAVPLALSLRQFLPVDLYYQISLSIAVLVIVGMALYRTGPAGRAGLWSRLRHPVRSRGNGTPAPPLQ